MSIPPLRAAVIGLGVGGAHIEGYLKSPDTQLVAICDINPETLKARTQRYNLTDVATYTDSDALLTEAKPDIVSVCLPNALHKDVTIKALQAGAHVLCEKPLATTVSDARAMLRAAQQAGRRLMTAYNHRYRADVEWIRDLIQAGRLGRIYAVDAWWRRETGIPGSGWFGKKEMAGGGALIDLGVHMLDMALYLMGFPRVITVNGSISSNFGSRGLKVWSMRGVNTFDPSKFTVEDYSAAFLRLEGDIVMTLRASWAEHRQPGEDLIRLEIQGTEGTALLTVPNYTRQDTVRFFTEIGGKPTVVIPNLKWDGDYGHEALIADVVRALVRGEPSPADGVHGFVGVQVLEAVYQASRTGREVVLSGTDE